MGVGKNRRGPARAMEEGIASGVQPSPQLPRENPDRKETIIERCPFFRLLFLFSANRKNRQVIFLGDSRKKRKKAKEGMAEKWEAEKWGWGKIAAALRVRWRSDRAGIAPAAGRMNPGTYCSDRPGLQLLYRRR